MKRIHILTAAAVVAASLGLVAASEAQMMGPGFGYGPGSGYGPGAGYGPGMGHGMGYGMGPGYFAPNGVGDPAANAEARLTALHTQLGITSAQESAWQAFATAMTQQWQQMQTFHDQMVQSTASAPERFTLMSGFMQARLAAMAGVQQALTELYGVLTPEQRAVVDQQFARGPRGPWGGPFGR